MDSVVTCPICDQQVAMADMDVHMEVHEQVLDLPPASQPGPSRLRASSTAGSTTSKAKRVSISDQLKTQSSFPEPPVKQQSYPDSSLDFVAASVPLSVYPVSINESMPEPQQMDDDDEIVAARLHEQELYDAEQQREQAMYQQNMPGAKIIRSAALLPDDEEDMQPLSQFRYVHQFSQDSLHELDISTLDRKMIAKRMDDHPSRFIQFHAERNAIDATTQTTEKAQPVKRGGLALPSEQMRSPLFADEEDINRSLDELMPHVPLGMEHSTLGRQDIAKKLGVKVEALEVKNGKVQLSQDGLNVYVPDDKRRKRGITISNRRAKMSVTERRFHDFQRAQKQRMDNLNKQFSLWNSHLRLIESRFGTGIVQFFGSYRWVFKMNLFLAFMWFVFVVMFGIIYSCQNDYEGFKKIHFKLLDNKGRFNIGQLLGDLFSGGQTFSNTFFFENGYPATINLGDPNNPYKMDLAYLSVIFATYVFSFIMTVMRMKALYVARPEVSGNIKSVDQVVPFSTSVFSSWDFAISSETTRYNHSFAIATVFKTLISKLEIQEKKNRDGDKYYSQNVARRVFGNLLVIIILGLSGFGIYITLNLEYTPENLSSLGINISDDTIKAIKANQFISITAFSISFLNLFLPQLFKAIARFERYRNPAVASNITLARAYVTKVAAIYVILVSLYIANRFKQPNWEYAVGQNFYQLVWTNFIFTIGGTGFYGLIARYVRGRQYYNFGIAENSLELIYQQALVWIGMTYSPVVGIIVVITSYMLFFYKKFILSTCGLPPRRVYNSYTQNFYFLFFLLLTLGLMAFPTFFSITQFVPTTTAGPFQPHVNKYNVTVPLQSIYDKVPQAIQELDSQFLRDVLSFIGSIGFVLPLVMTMALIIYYMQARAFKRERQVKKLSQEVKTERADKAFLLKYYHVKSS